MSKRLLINHFVPLVYHEQEVADQSLCAIGVP